MARRREDKLGGNAYDRWKTEPPEPKIVGHCVECDEPLSEGEEVIQVDDCELVCLDCWPDYAMSTLNAEKIVLSKG